MSPLERARALLAQMSIEEKIGQVVSGMVFGLHDGRHELMLGTYSDDIAATFDIEVKNGALSFGA